MYKLAIIGDKDSIISFKVLGVDIYPVEFLENEEQLALKLKKL